MFIACEQRSVCVRATYTVSNSTTAPNFSKTFVSILLGVISMVKEDVLNTSTNYNQHGIGNGIRHQPNAPQMLCYI